MGYPPNIDGGLDVHVAHLFNELREKGIDVELVLPGDKAPDRERIIGVETGEGDMIQRARNLSQEVAEIAGDYDIVHTHDWFGAETGFKAKKYGDVKWVTTFHSLTSGRDRKPSEELQKFEEVAAENSDLLVAVSEKLAGVIIGNALTLGINSFLASHPINAPVGTISTRVTPDLLMTRSGWMMAASVVAGFVPAYLASKTEIVETIENR